MAPKDFLAEDRTGAVKFARIYSNLVSPPVMFTSLGLAIALIEQPTWTGFLWGASYGIMVSLLPILFVLFLLYTGRVEELHMTNTKERFWPYVSAILGAGLMLLATWWLDGPHLLFALLLFNLIELIALNIITIYWLISMHSTAAMATAVWIWLIWGWMWGLILGLPIVLSVCYVRLYLRRHTVAQVIVGLILGAFSVLILVPFGLIY